MAKPKVDTQAAFESLFGKVQTRAVSSLRMIPRERIIVEAQVRTSFPREELKGLRDNIRELKERGEGIEGTGILQPLVVIALEHDPDEPANFLLTIGERRFRATEPDGHGDIKWDDKWVGLEELPCLVTNSRPAGVRLLQIVENLQRQGVNPLDEARAFDKVMREERLSQNDLVKLLGKSRGYITNRLALLGYGSDVQEMVVSRETTLKHAPLIDAVKGDARFRRLLIKAVIEDEASVAEIRRRIDERDQANQPAPKASGSTTATPGHGGSQGASASSVPAQTETRSEANRAQNAALIERAGAAEQGRTQGRTQGSTSAADPLYAHIKPVTSFLRNARSDLSNLSLTHDYRSQVESELQAAEQEIAAIRKLMSKSP